MLSLIDSYSGNSLLIVAAAFVIAILFSLTIHEFAHAFMAYKQGDLTAKAYGRLSLNPFAHIDPIGFIALLLLGFGWAKPVPVNPTKFRDYRKGMVLVSIAGVVINLILFLIFSFVTVLIVENFGSINIMTGFTLFICILPSFLMSINLSLAIFNLLPIRPLDGFNLVVALSKRRNSFLTFMERNGQFVLIFLLFTGLLERIIYTLSSLIYEPVISFWITLLT